MVLASYTGVANIANTACSTHHCLENAIVQKRRL